MKTIKVIIVDDHSLFAESLQFLMQTIEQVEVLGIYENGKEFITKIKNLTDLPDVILLDVNMPIMDGVETMKWIKEHHPEIKVLALSVNNDEETITKMITNGAKGYLLKDTKPKDFKEALLQVYEKGFYYTELVSGILINKLDGKHEKPLLKEREIEFMKLACTEKTYKEIADVMCLSPKTIDGYRENLFVKLDVNSRIGLVLYAIKNKIIML